MLDKLRGEVFIGAAIAGQTECDIEKVEREHAHPAGGVGLFQTTMAETL